MEEGYSTVDYPRGDKKSTGRYWSGDEWVLEEEDKDATSATVISEMKKSGTNKMVKEYHRDSADGQDGLQKEEHVEDQKDTESRDACW